MVDNPAHYDLWYKFYRVMEISLRYIGVESRIVHRMRRAVSLMVIIGIGILFSMLLNL